MWPFVSLSNRPEDRTFSHPFGRIWLWRAPRSRGVCDCGCGRYDPDCAGTAGNPQASNCIHPGRRGVLISPCLVFLGPQCTFTVSFSGGRGPLLKIDKQGYPQPSLSTGVPRFASVNFFPWLFQRDTGLGGGLLVFTLLAR